MTGFLRQTRVRLALAYAGVFTVVALIAAGALWLALVRGEYTAIDDSLAAQARAVASGVDSGGGGQSGGNGDNVDNTPSAGSKTTLPGSTPGGVAIGSLLFSRDGRLIDRSGQAPPAAALAPLVRQAASSGAVIVQTQTINGIAERVRAARIDLGNGTTGVLVLARPVAEAEQRLARTAFTILVGLVLMVLAATLLGYWLAGRALRPVREIAATARDFGEHDLHRRITLDLPPDELGELAATFNAMLARLEVSFETLRRFTADAAHELRAPLTLIRTEAEVSLRKARTPEQYQASLSTVLAEAERLGRLADQLLMLARADAGALVPQMVDVDLPDLVEDTVERWQALAGKREVTLSCEASGTGEVLGDPDLLRRLLDNLIDNGIRHTPRGGTVAVSAAREGDSWRVAVADSGPGVDAAMRSILFERFTRADHARGRDTGGAGLGLALCAVIAELHHGSIRLGEDGNGPGAEFLVRLPAQTR